MSLERIHLDTQTNACSSSVSLSRPPLSAFIFVCQYKALPEPYDPVNRHALSGNALVFGPHASRSARTPPPGAARRPRSGSPRRAAPRPDAPRLRASRSDRRVLGLPREPRFAELLIDCEEDRVLRAVLVGMLREHYR
jgi:hypothetical protein